MRFELKSISLWAFIKVAFFVNMIFGFLIGVLYAFLFGFIMAVMQNLPYMPQEEFPPSDAPIGVLVVVIPFFFALMGGFVYTLMGVVGVAIYNLVAKITGGLEFNLNSIVELAPVPTPIQAQTQMPPNPMPPPPPPPVNEFHPEPPPTQPPHDPREDEFPSRTVGG